MSYSKYGYLTENQLNSGLSTDTGYSIINKLTIGTYNFVTALADLPVPINNVITLAAQNTYHFIGSVNIGNNRLVCGANTMIKGSSSENSQITGASPLISSAYTLPIRDITLNATTILALDASLTGGNNALDWFGVNFNGAIGTIKGYTNFLATSCAVLSCTNGFIFDGTFGTIGFNQCFFTQGITNPYITIASTCTILRRFRVIYSSFIVDAIGIQVSESATIPPEGYILDTVNFSGSGTYCTGVTYNDTKALFKNVVGLPNSTSAAIAYMNNNATATVISATNTFYKIAGTTSASSINQKFTHANSKLTYVGGITRIFQVLVLATPEASSTNVIEVKIYKNGVAINETLQTCVIPTGSNSFENLGLHGITELATNDYIEVFIRNVSATVNIVVKNLHITITEIF